MDSLKIFDIIIYHKNCADGFGGAYVALKYYKENKIHHDVELMPMFHDDFFDFDHLTDKSILMIDISFSRETVMKIRKVATRLLILDHHDTVQKELGDLPYAYFDLTKSGVRLAWEHFFPDKKEKMPKFLEWVELRDVYKHEKHIDNQDYSIEAFFSAFKLESTFEQYEDLCDPISSTFKDTINKGYQSLYKDLDLIEELKKHQEHKKIGKYSVLFIHLFAQEFFRIVSKLGNEMTKPKAYQNHIAMIAIDLGNGTTKVCLRSHEKGPDVGEFAKQKFNGGGRPCTAGFMWNNKKKNIKEIFD